MKCTNHPEIEAEGMCTYCGKPFCKECLVEVKGKMYCKSDLGNVLDEAKQTNNGQPTINITNANANNNNNNNNVAPAFGTIYGAQKSKMLALILCCLGFIGFSGIHRMYVGKVGSGVLYFLTGGLCFVGTVLDIISILSGGFRDSFGRPLL